MSRGVWLDSRAQKVVSCMPIDKTVTVAQLAALPELQDLSREQIADTLHNRARGTQDVTKVGKSWMRTHSVTPRAKRKPAWRGQVAQPRTAVVFREWRHNQAIPLRPGANDYRAVPSLQGNDHAAYIGVASIHLTTRDHVASGLK